MIIYIAIAALWGTSAWRGKLTPVLVFYTQVSRWWQWFGVFTSTYKAAAYISCDKCHYKRYCWFVMRITGKRRWIQSCIPIRISARIVVWKSTTILYGDCSTLHCGDTVQGENCTEIFDELGDWIVEGWEWARLSRPQVGTLSLDKLMPMRVTTGSLDLRLQGGAAPFLPKPLGKSVVNKLVRFGFFFLHNEMNCKSLPLISATATECAHIPNDFQLTQLESQQKDRLSFGVTIWGTFPL